MDQHASAPHHGHEIGGLASMATRQSIPRVKICAVYAIWRIGTGECYVGSSRDIRSRWYHHKGDLRRGINNSVALQAAWTLYGEQAFLFSILEQCSIEQLIPREQFYMDLLPSVYNIGRFADASRRGIPSPLRGIPRPIETIAKMSAALMGHPGWRKTPDEKARISVALCGRPVSAETRRKISLAQARSHASGHRAPGPQRAVTGHFLKKIRPT